jgi:hypothetical protein
LLKVRFIHDKAQTFTDLAGAPVPGNTKILVAGRLGDDIFHRDRRAGRME